jgi:hypothetical protein
MSEDTSKELYLGSVGYRDCDPLFFVITRTVSTFNEKAEDIIKEAKADILDEGEDYDTEIYIYGPTAEKVETIREQLDKGLKAEFDTWLAEDNKEPFVFF